MELLFSSLVLFSWVLFDKWWVLQVLSISKQVINVMRSYFIISYENKGGFAEWWFQIHDDCRQKNFKKYFINFIHPLIFFFNIANNDWSLLVYEKNFFFPIRIPLKMYYPRGKIPKNCIPVIMKRLVHPIRNFKNQKKM